MPGAQVERSGCASRLGVDIDGGLVYLSAEYDPTLVAAIRALPERRFIRERAEWVLPARRPALARLVELIESYGEQVRLTERAQRRLERSRLGRIGLCPEGEFELSFEPSPPRLEAVRALPERRYLAELRRWRVPATRAGALALRALGDGDWVVEGRARALVERLVRAQAAGAQSERQHEVSGGRAPPSPHWRHIVRGPIFEAADPGRREWVAGIGWCVRVRVDPRRRTGGR